MGKFQNITLWNADNIFYRMFGAPWKQGLRIFAKMETKIRATRPWTLVYIDRKMKLESYPKALTDSTCNGCSNGKSALPYTNKVSFSVEGMSMLNLEIIESIFGTGKSKLAICDNFLENSIITLGCICKDRGMWTTIWMKPKSE